MYDVSFFALPMSPAPVYSAHDAFLPGGSSRPPFSSSSLAVGEGVCLAMPAADEARALLDTAAVALLEPLRKEFHKLMGEG